MSLDGRNRLWDTNGEKASCVECLPQRLVIEAEGTRHRVDPESLRCLGAFNRPLDLGQEGQDRAGIARIPRGPWFAQSKPVAGSDTMPGFRPHGAGP